MHDVSHAKTARRASVPSRALGFRRIEQVRVIVGNGRPIAEVTGVVHRYPHTFRIPLAAVAQLADAGVPLRIDYRSDSERGGSR